MVRTVIMLARYVGRHGLASSREREHASPLFVLTNVPGLPYLRAMSLERTLQIIQYAYPQVYLACHTRHQRKRSTPHHLSARDSSILAHLDQQHFTTPARLAVHLSIARSTLSEALKRLTALGYTTQVRRASAAGARGGVAILLTPKGATAIRDTSVLEVARLRNVLERLTPAELRAVARGMSVLGSACTRPEAEETDATEVGA